MGKLIQTVNGPLPVEELGVTLMHEHVLQANWSMRMSYPHWFNYNEFIEYATEDVKRTKEIGVCTLVEQTPVCLGRDIHAIKEVADRTGMQIIASTGFFYTENQWLFGRSEESLMECMRKDINEGIQDTDIRPGLIKCATDVAGITPINRVLLNAHAQMAKESGLPIGTHSYYGNRSGLGQMDIFESYGLDPKKILIGHCGDTNDIGYLEELLSRGCYIGLDRFGDDAKNPLKNRVDTLLKLCEDGWIDQLMISHDYVSFVDLGCFEWKDKRGTDPDDAVYNSRYIHRYVLPLLRELGFGEDGIHQLLVDNPRAFFSR